MLQLVKLESSYMINDIHIHKETNFSSFYRESIWLDHFSAIIQRYYSLNSSQNTKL